ncbi:MAG: transglutaminase domain-containing protein [Methanomassiliicoccales archaeon]|nr:transglutaminase domain-containing protein [Methanomassiliicoccales archaeon]MDD1756654.1 transglutaminase domain-containing protein [Methanomassiliicoccales archaeon]
MVKIAVVLIVVLLVVVILITPSVQNVIAQFLLSPFQERVPKNATYTLERTLSVDANGGTISSFTLDLPLPRHVQGDDYSLQSVISVTDSPHGEQVIRYGYEWKVWDHGPLTGAQTYVVHITYQIRVDTYIWEIDGQSAGTTDDVPIGVKNSYLHNEWASGDSWMIDTTAPAIQQKAQEIVGGETNVYTILQRIYQWTTENVGYSSSGLTGEPKTSLETLESLMGDCDDQALLFCSLARASGVPAWLQLGALYDRSHDSWFGHGWVQAYVPLQDGGYENVVIDTVNRDFLRWMPNRIVEYTDDGNGDHLSDFYYSFNYYYDDGTYLPGQGPLYEEEYISIDHSESAETVVVGSILASSIQWEVAPSRLKSLGA